MSLWNPEAIDLAGGPAALDEVLPVVPDRTAVFLVFPSQGLPYLGRTTLFRRRLGRLLGERERPSRFLSLRNVAVRIEYQLTASSLETSLLLHEVARAHFGEDYGRVIKLRMPPYLKIVLTNAYPRSQITTRLSASRALYYGPFRSRAAAEHFEARFLDLFQVRRCQEELAPSPSHPGCIYGEMNACLRPCQQAVTAEEYAGEVDRVLQFLYSNGRSALEALSHDRDRASQGTDFEQAARLHKQLEKVEAVLKLRDDLVAESSRLNGVAVTPSVAPGCVGLWFLIDGGWQPPVWFSLEAVGRSVSLDERLRRAVTALAPRRLTVRERQEHVALLARWYYSGRRDGEWLPFDDLAGLPYRKLVRAIARTARPAEEPTDSALKSSL